MTAAKACGTQDGCEIRSGPPPKADRVPLSLKPAVFLSQVYSCIAVVNIPWDIPISRLQPWAPGILGMAGASCGLIWGQGLCGLKDELGFPGGCGESRCEPSQVQPPKTQDATPCRTREAGGQRNWGPAGDVAGEAGERHCLSWALPVPAMGMQWRPKVGATVFILQKVRMLFKGVEACHWRGFALPVATWKVD